MKLVLPALCAALVLSACRPETTPAPVTRAPEATAPSEPDAGKAPSKSASDTPVLKVKTVDGRDYDLAAQRGKWVVVNFWATWCAPCLKEMPELSALDAMREHVEVIGLAYEEIEPAQMQAFLQKHPVVYPVAIVDVYDPPAGFDTPRGLPMTYLIAPDGKLAKQFLGPVTARELEAAIAAGGGPAAAA